MLLMFGASTPLFYKIFGRTVTKFEFSYLPHTVNAAYPPFFKILLHSEIILSGFSVIIKTKLET